MLQKAIQQLSNGTSLKSVLEDLLEARSVPTPNAEEQSVIAFLQSAAKRSEQGEAPGAMSDLRIMHGFEQINDARFRATKKIRLASIPTQPSRNTRLYQAGGPDSEINPRLPEASSSIVYNVYRTNGGIITHLSVTYPHPHGGPLRFILFRPYGGQLVHEGTALQHAGRAVAHGVAAGVSAFLGAEGAHSFINPRYHRASGRIFHRGLKNEKSAFKRAEYKVRSAFHGTSGKHPIASGALGVAGGAAAIHQGSRAIDHAKKAIKAFRRKKAKEQ